MLFLAVSALFTAMNAGALQQGVFFFHHPDFLGMPVWEFFMWGFYVLHLIRMVDGPAPEGKLWTPPRPGDRVRNPVLHGRRRADTCSSPLRSSSAWRSRSSMSASTSPTRGYMILVGALIEYTGVWSGQWGYPGSPPGGVPLWFVTMWGGRRPLHAAARAADPSTLRQARRRSDQSFP